MNKRKIVIVGGSKGLGLSMAIKFSEENHQVYIVSRTKPNLDGIQETARDKVNWIFADINKIKDRVRIEDMVSNLGRFHLIINAAVATPNTIDNIKGNDLNLTVSTNLTSPIMVINSLLKFMKNSRVFFISSGLAQDHMTGLSAYCISKAGLNMAWRSYKDDIDAKVAIFGIFSPGIMDTEMQQQLRQEKVDIFPSKELFESFKIKNELLNPKYVSEYVYSIVSRSSDFTFSNTEWDINNKVEIL